MNFVLVLLLLAHSWYPKNCCDEKHCKPVPCNQLQKVDNGWFYVPLRLFVPDKAVQQSQDNDCHVCAALSLVYCVFIPPEPSV